MSPAHPPLQFLKLGGSLITEKAKPHTARPERIERLAAEIASAWQVSAKVGEGFHLLLGHGSGSFGHVPASRYGTRQGVHTAEGWLGFVEVWGEAASLNRLVMDNLAAAGLPAVAFPPSAAVFTRDGQPAAWSLEPLQAALNAGLLPVLYGDVVFDSVRGGTILSTEELFEYLAARLRPTRILLAGLEPGVWADFPDRTRLISEITPATFSQFTEALGGSAAADVTGGMASKVQQSLALVEAVPGLEVLIFSGEQPGEVERTLRGEQAGTRVWSG